MRNHDLHCDRSFNDTQAFRPSRLRIWLIRYHINSNNACAICFLGFNTGCTASRLDHEEYLADLKAAK